MEWTALAENLNAANAGELPDPRAIRVLKKNGTISRIQIKPMEKRPPISEKTKRDIHRRTRTERAAGKITRPASGALCKRRG